MFGKTYQNKRGLTAGEEAHGKRVKFDDGVVKGKVDIVRDAVGLDHPRIRRSDKTHMMLENMVPGSLGPGLDERDELQDEVVEIIGKVIDEVQNALEKNVDRKQLAVNDPVAAMAALEKEKAEAEARVQKDNEARAAAMKALEDARDELAKADDKLEEEKAKLHDLKAEQEKKKMEYEAFNDAYKSHFLPLKNDEIMSVSDAGIHISVLLPLFQMFAYEKSLMMGFKPAGLLRPRERNHFDVVVFENAEKGFKKKLAAALADLKALEPLIAKAEKAVQAAEAAVEKALQKEMAAGQLFGKLAKDNALLQDIIDEIANFPRNPEEARKQLADAQRALQEFLDGPRAAYEFLRDRVSALAHVDNLEAYMNLRAIG